jgi:hypothetical protein
MAVDYVEDPIDRVVKITVDVGPVDISLGINFYALPYHMWAGVDSATIATLSVVGLPPLSPNVFKVNISHGITPPPFLTPEYGGSTNLTMPDGTGTLNAAWGLVWGDNGAVVYSSHGAARPFLGQNELEISVVLQLRPLDFLGSGSADNHYNWGGGASVTGLSGVGPIPSISGRAGSAAVLTFTLAVTLDPPNATFSAG